MPRWEYDMVSVEHAESYTGIRDEFNILGQQKWELVTVTNAGTAIFKRELPEAIPGEDPSGPVSLMEADAASWDRSERPVANN